MSKLILFTDGGSRNNPGPAGIGGVATNGEGEIFRFKKYLGTKTNNQAEYLALIEGLRKAREAGFKDIDCFLDSELVVNQLNGRYKVKHEDLKPLVAEVRGLLLDFNKVTFTAVLRDKNKIADSLVNEAIDEAILS